MKRARTLLTPVALAALCTGVAGLACDSHVQSSAEATRQSSTAIPAYLVPEGVYAVVNLTNYLAGFQALYGVLPTDQDMKDFIDELLANRDVAGIRLTLSWNSAQPNDAGHYDGPHYFTFANDVFAEAKAKSKTIQLDVVGGFQTPDWFFANNPSCDPLFAGQSYVPGCDWVSLTSYAEPVDEIHIVQVLTNPDNMRPVWVPEVALYFPLPWSGDYLDAWNAFIENIAGRYGPTSLYAGTLASITISGPLGSTSEFILPSNNAVCNGTGPCWGSPWSAALPVTNDQYTPGSACGSLPSCLPGNTASCCMTPDAMLAALMVEQGVANNPLDATVDSAFVQPFTGAAPRGQIAHYASLFSGITFVMVPDSGTRFPDFSSLGVTPPSSPPDSYTEGICSLSFKPNSPADSKDRIPCLAITSVVEGALVSGALGANGLATMTGGLTATTSSTLGRDASSGNWGLPGVKYTTFLNPGVAGGAFQDHPTTTMNFDGWTNFVGGAAFCGSQPNGRCTPEQASFNVFQNFFAGTYAYSGFSSTQALVGSKPTNFPNPPPPGTGLLSYLDVQEEDILFAGGSCPPATAVLNHLQGDVSIGNPTAQDLLDLVAKNLSFLSSNPTGTPPSLSLSSCVPLAGSHFASGQGPATGIATNGTTVCWTQKEVGGAVSCQPVTGGTPSTIATNQGTPAYIAMDATNVYWTNFGGGNVVTKPISGGTRTVLAQGTNPNRIVIDANNVYWTDGGSVYRSNKSTSGKTLLGTGPGTAMGLAVDSTNVYWTYQNGSLEGGVLSAPIGGGGPVATLSRDPSWCPGDIVVSGGSSLSNKHNVFWADACTGAGTTHGSIFSTPITSSVAFPSTIAASTQHLQWTPRNLATDGQMLYWGQSDGSVVRVPLDALTGPGSIPMALDRTGTAPEAIGISPDGTQVFWADSAQGVILHASLPPWKQ